MPRLGLLCAARASITSRMSSRVQLKVVLLGEMDCGKTSLVTRYMSGTFSSKTQTVSSLTSQQAARCACVDAFWTLDAPGGRK